MIITVKETAGYKGVIYKPYEKIEIDKEDESVVKKILKGKYTEVRTVRNKAKE